MKYYAHNVGDWLPATIDLSMTEEGAYRRLMDWYYSNEQPLPLSSRELNKIARCRSPADRNAVRTIVDRFFTITEDGYHHERIDRDVKAFAMGEPMRALKRDANNERKRRSREKRIATWAALTSKGIAAPLNSTQAELDELLRKHGVTRVVTRDMTQDSEGDLARDRAVNQEPITNRGGHAVPPPASAGAQAREAAAGGEVVVIESMPTESRVGAAGRALKASGFPMVQANTADPRFLALLQAGVSDEELRLTGAEASARGKGWGWLVATIAGRHADVANGFASRRAGMGPKRDERDRVAGLTPTIAQKRGNAL